MALHPPLTLVHKNSHAHVSEILQSLRQTYTAPHSSTLIQPISRACTTVSQEADQYSSIYESLPSNSSFFTWRIYCGAPQIQKTVPKWISDQLDRYPVGTLPYLVGWLCLEGCGLTGHTLLYMEAHNKWRMTAGILGPASPNVFINDLEEAMDVVSSTLQTTSN